MSVEIVGALWLVAMLLPGQPQAAVASYTQAYQILIKGAPAGTETVRETADKDGNLVSTSEHELLVSDGLETKRAAYMTELVLSKGTREPIRYKLQYTSGESHDSCEVIVNGKQLNRILIRGNRKSETSTPLQPGMVLLEPNVYHLYELLVGRYDFKKGGRQVFQAYLPPVGADIPAALTWMEDGNVDTLAGPVPARTFKFEYVALSNGILSVDKSGRLVRLLNPAQELDVVRK